MMSWLVSRALVAAQVQGFQLIEGVGVSGTCVVTRGGRTAQYRVVSTRG